METVPTITQREELLFKGSSTCLHQPPHEKSIPRHRDSQRLSVNRISWILSSRSTIHTMMTVRFNSTFIITRILPAFSILHSFSTTTTTAALSSTMKPPRVDSVTPVASTKWLALETLHWTDEDGKPRQWDSATRTTKPKNDKANNSGSSSSDAASGAADAVAIIPLLRHRTKKKDGTTYSGVDTLLVEQFRPPVRQTTVEFPAGLIDPGESIENAALRELREETGYVGEKCQIPPQVSRQTCMSPGLCDETIHVVVVEVDLDNPYNQGTPTPALDPGEFVTVKRVPLNEGLQKVLDQGEGMPIMGLYLFAVGYALGAEQQPK